MKKAIRFPLFAALRPNQWIKNLILFAAIIFNGKIFDIQYLILTFEGFLAFCALSSCSYIVNDIIDLRFDRLHPIKKHRPIASGQVSLNTAVEIAFLLGLFGLILALLLSPIFFLTAATFLFVHILYSTVLKKHAVLDILGISFSFIIRTFAGEVLTAYHLPFWLFLTIMFGSLFVAATKRHAELLKEGEQTRPTLFQYRERLLDSYTSMFASASIIAYSLFAFLESPPQFAAPLRDFLMMTLPHAVDRKWMVVTIPFFIYGLMRYAQLAYVGTDAEQPEKIVTKDIPLIVSIFGWGIMIILILYVL